ncbi:MAG: preprotein translocase subunit YajC [Phycisphaeraceae bacterium]|nr:MAG: preprotein translocase subunit YajC [Phycisphaeraceae bacterium]
MSSANLAWASEAGWVGVVGSAGPNGPAAGGGNPSSRSLGGVATEGGGAAGGESSGLGTPGGAPAVRPGGFDPMMFLLPLLLFMIVMMFMSGRREKKKRQELLAAIKRGDVVQTIGGAIGTIVDIRDNEVVLKFEEGRVRFNKTAIQGVVGGHKANGHLEAKPDVRSGVGVG